MAEKKSIAVIGGTGAEGSALALRFANAGHSVIIGSRDAVKAQTTASEINAKLTSSYASGSNNEKAAESAEIVVMTVPFSGQQATALALQGQLRGKVLIDATVPLVPPKVGRVQMPEGGSAVARLQELLGEEVKVVSAFQNVSAHHLKDLDHDVSCDVLVCGDDPVACETTLSLVNSIGLRGIYAGPIANSAAAEALTSVLITINRRYKAKGSGLRITGLD